MRDNPLSEGKFYKNLCSYSRTFLETLINTRNLVLSIPADKSKNSVATLLTAWHVSRKRLTLREACYVLGLAANLVLATQWVKCTCVGLNHAVFFALKFNSNAVFSICKFKYTTELLTSKNVKIKNFYLSKSCKTAWNSKENFSITNL